jgi:hypothetical protein
LHKHNPNSKASIFEIKKIKIKTLPDTQATYPEYLGS